MKVHYMPRRMLVVWHVCTFMVGVMVSICLITCWFFALSVCLSLHLLILRFTKNSMTASAMQTRA